MRIALSLALLFALVVAAPRAAAAAGGEGGAPGKIRRFAFLVGANDGGADRQKLRYAESDAARMAQILIDIGGVAEEDVLLLQSSSVAQVRAGLEKLRKRLAAAQKAGVRVELVVYYSGHSDETGLLLAGERLDYAELRAEIKAMPAAVHVVILDSCASGAFTRAKGGTKQAPFLVDESTQVEGYAFISSSSEDEVAQESDAIAASFFTHYLASGLRGAADINGDGKVTLSEAYQHAFDETVARTEAAEGLAQHPAYNMHLAGTGDLVITDLRATNATLVIDEEIAGRLFIRDAEGRLVVELAKPAGREVMLALGAGSYSVSLQTKKGLRSAQVTLVAGKATRVVDKTFGAARLEPTVSRGGGGAGADGAQAAPFRLSLVPPLSTGHDRAVVNVSLNVIAGVNLGVSGFELGGVANVVEQDVRGLQIGGVVNVVGGDARGLQIGGVVNVVGGDARGLQIGGVSNYAAGRADMQLAGVVNVAGVVNGFQLGVVNVGRRNRGLQLGIINVAEESDASVGIINIVGNGYRVAEAWASDAMPLQAGLKLGSRRVYSLLSAGLDREQVQVGLGLGVHSAWGRVHLDVDASAYQVYDHDFEETIEDLLLVARVAVGYSPRERFTLFGGLSGSVVTVERPTPGLFVGIGFW